MVKNPRTSLRRDSGQMNFGCPPDMFDQAILILPHLEKVVVFAELFHRAFAVRTEAIGDIFLRPKPFIKCAVPPSVGSLVNQLVIIKLLKVSLNHCFVSGVSRSDEGIVRNVEAFPELLKLRCQLVAMRLRIDPGFGCGLLNFLAMFVEPGKKEDVTSVANANSVQVHQRR